MKIFFLINQLVKQNQSLLRVATSFLKVLIFIVSIASRLAPAVGDVIDDEEGENDGEKKEDAHDETTHASLSITVNEPPGEGAGQLMGLVSDADEYEGGGEEVEGGPACHHQHTFPVSRRPYVILRDEQLQIDGTEPGKEGTEAGTDVARNVSQR